MPYHFLLSSIGKRGKLCYQDISTGERVAEFSTHMGECRVMRHNPRNAIMNLGHFNGQVTMWAPSVNKPLVKMLCHKGAVRALAVDPSGRYIATAGADRRMKLFDVRNYKMLEDYPLYGQPTAMDFSQTGLLAVGYGPNVEVWKNPGRRSASGGKPYMKHLVGGHTVSDLRFAPFEDFLAVGSTEGVQTIAIPGAGEANFDSYELNPFESKTERREREVRMLLEKIPFDMIQLDENFLATKTAENKRPVAYPKSKRSRKRAKSKAARAAVEAKQQLPKPKKDLEEALDIFG